MRAIRFASALGRATDTVITTEETFGSVTRSTQRCPVLDKRHLHRVATENKICAVWEEGATKMIRKRHALSKAVGIMLLGALCAIAALEGAARAQAPN
jgi:hypothetical protein